MQVTVVIVSYNVRSFLEQCLLSIQAASSHLDVEVVVVDNNSSDASVEMLQEKYPWVKCIQNPQNTGFSKANNQGVSLARGRYILVLNPDTVLAEDTFDLLIEFANSKPDLGIVGAKLIDGTGHFLPESKRNIPSLWTSFWKLFFIGSQSGKGYYASQLHKDATGRVPVLVGAFMFMERSVYLEVGGFDEDYFMYGEDIDLSYRVLKKGYQNYYYSAVRVLHYKGESTLKNRQYLKHFTNSMALFYKKHFGIYRFKYLLVYLGTCLWYIGAFFKKSSKKYKKPLDSLLYIGRNEALLTHLKGRYRVCSVQQEAGLQELQSVISSQQISLVVFDNQWLSNKQILQYMEALKESNLRFRIHPRSTNFLIGSDTAVERGTVDQLPASCIARM
ncbi:MAG: glycosyltransferase family 2 protein [Lutibacter sp.]|nr:glycosyltransferase family 2 protein [Lutibacter sp.]